MPLTRSLIEEQSAAYREEEPLYVVEAEQIETLGDALEAGEYGWRDVEWLVQWYYRRHLGALPDDERRAREEAFAENDFEVIRETIAAVSEREDVDHQVMQLTQLTGVDVGVASAILMFLKPASYLSIGDREWSVLHQQDELNSPPPSSFTRTDYQMYLERCRSIATRAECSLWTLYQALWRLSAPRDHGH